LINPEAYKYLIENKNFHKLTTKLTESLDLNTIYLIMVKANEAVLFYQMKSNNVTLISDELLSRYRIGVVKPLADINRYIPLPANADPIKQFIVKNISNLAEIVHFLNYENNLFTSIKNTNYKINKWVDVPDLNDYIFKLYFYYLDNLIQIKVYLF
jgi:hypothetical protein